jgi:hypothetical protein
VSKFLLNLLVEILKILLNSEIYLNSKIKTLLFSFRLSAQPAHSAFWPTRPHRPPSSSFTMPAHSFLGYRLPSLGPLGPITLGVFLGICFLLVKEPTMEPAGLLLPSPAPK